MYVEGEGVSQERERERERERVIKGWQVCLTTCILAIFACLAFTSAPAFADEGDGASNTELQDSNIVHIKGGTSFNDAASLPLNTTNTFSQDAKDREYYFKFTLTDDGSLNLPKIDAGSEKVNGTSFKIYNSSKEIIYFFGYYDYESYENMTVGMAKGTYYLKFKVGYWNTVNTIQLRLNYTKSDAWEKEPNDAFEYANNVSVNKVYYGSGANNTDDYFKFVLNQTSRVRIAAKNNLGHWYCLYGSDKNQITRWYQNEKGGLTVDEDADLTLQKGTYYFKIVSDSRDMEYSFQIMSTAVSKISMHRLYNRWTGEHFYTSNTTEKNDLAKKGWSYEGVGWNAPSTSSKPVYRLYNPYVEGGDHHYTMDSNERDSLIKRGWSDEGIGWYSDPNQGVPLYRQYNPYATTGTHNYTTNKSENDDLVKEGWRAEGVSWYGLT